MLEGWWAALVVASVWAAGAGGEMARILHRRTEPSVSSSTLEWVDVDPGQPLPRGALQVSEDGGAWCRLKESGGLAGVVRDGVCYAPFLGSVISSESNKYEILVSINDSARLKEIEWTRPAALSPGGIEVSKNRLMALVRTAEGDVLPGYVDLQNRRATVLNDDKSENHEEAKILSEEEPTAYELDNIVREESRAKVNFKDEVLAEFTLENPSTEAQEVSQSVEYQIKEELYWGNVRGTVKGITASVTGPSGDEREVYWGDVGHFERYGQQKVSLEVPPNAAVDVNLVGVMHKYESPYTGNLTAKFKDETRKSRLVTALHSHLYMAELRADYSRPRSLDDGRELEGEFPTSEVLVASTTTTTTTTTTTASPGTDPVPTKDSLGTDMSSAEALSGLRLSLLVCCVALLLRLARP